VRVLVLGGTGLLGNRLARELSNKFEVFATTRMVADDHSHLAKILEPSQWLSNFDVLNIEAVEKTLFDLRPEVIINCLGITKHQDFSKEFETIVRVNSFFPYQLCNISAKLGCKLVLISTDCVFSGNKGNYSESSIPDPVDLYGRSKALGEIDSSGVLTLRTSFVGREIKSFTNLFEWARLNRGCQVAGYKQAIYSGLTTQALSVVIRNILVEHLNLEGLFHVSSEPISKFDLLSQLNERLKLGIRLIPNDSFVCDRTLNCQSFKMVTKMTLPDWNKMLEDYAVDEDWYATVLGNAESTV